MGLTKIHGWKGEAEILGGLYEVEFEHGALLIKGLDLDTSYVVLEELAAKKIVSVRVGRQVPPIQETAPVKAEVKVPEKAPPPAPAAPAQKELPPWDPKVEFPDEPKQEVPPKPAPAPAPEPAKGLDMEEEKPVAVPVESTGGVPSEIQNAPNVISILDWLVKNKGLSPKDVPAMVKAAQEIAPHVGLLRRMGAKLPERIASTLEMYSEGGG